MKKVLPPDVSELIERHAAISARSLTDICRVAVRRSRPEQRWDRVHHSLHLPLRLLQSDFRILLCGRIQHDGVQGGRPPGLIANDGDAGMKPSVLPVRAQDTMDLFVAVPSAKQLPPEALRFLKIIWMDEINPTVVLKFLKSPAGVLCRFSVHIDERPIRLSLPQKRGKSFGKVDVDRRWHGLNVRHSR